MQQPPNDPHDFRVRYTPGPPPGHPEDPHGTPPAPPAAPVFDPFGTAPPDERTRELLDRLAARRQAEQGSSGRFWPLVLAWTKGGAVIGLIGGLGEYTNYAYGFEGVLTVITVGITCILMSMKYGILGFVLGTAAGGIRVAYAASKNLPPPVWRKPPYRFLTPSFYVCIGCGVLFAPVLYVLEFFELMMT